MLNPELKLNEKIFTDTVEQKAPRDGFGEGLVELGKINKDVVVLSADLSESTRTQKFSELYPERFFEMGVAEQNMAAIGAGLGISGKIPFISSYAMFSPGRNWEQIRTTICYNDSNVKIAGAHAGISVGPDGATHQALEDVAITRVLPNMKVFVPCDSLEVKKMTLAAAQMWGPVYFRFGREKTPVITTEKTSFVPGKMEAFWIPTNGKKPDVAIFVSGTLMTNALLAAEQLEREKIYVAVLNAHSVKPLDERMTLEFAKRCGAIVSVEEHQVIGGMGSAISEFLSKNFPVPQEFIGVKNSFGESGKPDELIDLYGMGVKDIMRAVEKVIKRKSK